MLAQQLIRNEGKPFSEYEYGIAFRKFVDFGYTSKEISEKLGIKRWKVDSFLAHLNRDERVQKLMREGRITGVDVRHIYQATKDEAKAVKQILRLAEKAENKGEKKLSLKDLNMDDDYNVVKDTATVKKGLATLFMYINSYTNDGAIELNMDIYDIYEAITSGKRTLKDVFDKAVKDAKNIA